MHRMNGNAVLAAPLLGEATDLSHSVAVAFTTRARHNANCGCIKNVGIFFSFDFSGFTITECEKISRTKMQEVGAENRTYYRHRKEARE